MKKIGEMNLQEFETIVNRSKVLRDKLDNFIQEEELDFIREKLSKVKNSLSNWTIGFFERNFVTIKDYDDFVSGVRDYVDCYGSSEKLEKLLSQCEKLAGTNLFRHHANLLKELWMDEEINSIVKYVEDASMELYCGKVGEKSHDYLEQFVYNIEDWIFDDETGTFYKPTKLDAAA